MPAHSSTAIAGLPAPPRQAGVGVLRGEPPKCVFAYFLHKQKVGRRRQKGGHTMPGKEEFIEIYTQHIHREGSAELLDYLEHKSDFFTAPASARFHGSHAGGLCEHSVNVFRCLEAYLARERVKEVYGVDYPMESAAIAALLHDLCKIGCYKAGTRNVKDDATGKWEKVPTFFYEDKLPYGHGEKSVYIISGFMRLTRDEAMAIRWHMGFSGPEDSRMVGQALSQYPLAFALATADMEASYFLEGK